MHTKVFMCICIYVHTYMYTWASNSSASRVLEVRVVQGAQSPTKIFQGLFSSGLYIYIYRERERENLSLSLSLYIYMVPPCILRSGTMRTTAFYNACRMRVGPHVIAISHTMYHTRVCEISIWKNGFRPWQL